jgi:hypothetical protein
LQWKKNIIAMKIYDTLEILENKIYELIENIEDDLIKSIIEYDFYLNYFYSIFKN